LIVVLLYSPTANFFYRADPCKTGGKCGRLGKIDGLRSMPKNLQSDWFRTLLQSQSFGARIATEIKNWYSSQVFILSTSKYGPACRLEV